MTRPPHLEGRTASYPFLPSDFDELIDVRSPSEFAEDHIAGAINLPVLDDDERAEVGTLDKQVGQFEARRRGAAITSARIAEHLKSHFAEKPKTYRPLVYCWRGGMRSRSITTVLGAVGWKPTLLEGGYRSYRRYVIDALEELPPKLEFIAINGLTGSGKTRLLEALAARGNQMIDLEGLANHRGSVLGPTPDSPQPSTRAFESRLASTLTRLSPERPVFIEAESRKVGNRHLPDALWDKMTTSKVVRLEVPTPSRVDFLLRDYAYFVEDPDFLQGRLDALRARYGDATIDRWGELCATGEWKTFVTAILGEHYDPLYSKSTKYTAASLTVDVPAIDDKHLTSACEKIERWVVDDASA